MTVVVRSWSHTDNLGAALLADSYIATNLARPVCLTEKLDGSNCAFHIRRDNKQWCLVAIQGRNQHIWVPTPAPHPLTTEGETFIARAENQKGIPHVGYGNVGNLGALPAYAAHVAVEVAEAVGAEELMLYGEVFRARTAKTAQRNASFHPFGYKIIHGNSGASKSGEAAAPVTNAAAAPDSDDAADGEGSSTSNDDNVTTVRLTSRTHQLLSTFTVNAPPAGKTGGDALQEYLITNHVYVVCPPAIVYAGALYDGIDQLGASLDAAAPSLEGYFIAADDDLPYGMYCKWKTPLFEEQGRAPTLDELCASRAGYAKTGRVPSRTKLPDIVAELLTQSGGEDGKTALDRERAAVPGQLVQVLDVVAGLILKSKAVKAAHQPVKVAKVIGDKPDKVMKPYEAALRARISTAFARELTKDPALSALPAEPKQRKPIADRVCTAVIKEVLEQMEADGEVATKEMQADVGRWAVSTLVPVVMKGDFEAWKC